MNDEKMIYGLRTAVSVVNLIVMAITIVMQAIAFETLRHVIMCSSILLLIAITLTFDGILKDSNRIPKHICWYILWLFNLLISLF